MKITTFVNEIYPRALFVAVDCPDEVCSRFKLKSDDLEEISKDSFAGDLATCILVRERKGKARYGVAIHFDRSLFSKGGSVIVSTIAHESVHAANMIFNEIGVHYTTYDDEHFAYLVGWISKKCWKVLQEYIV